jgi:hypothetical protein
VTSLTTEAASFFSRGLRVKGQPGPKDVACGVFIGLCGVSASLADKLRLGEPICSSRMPAGFAAVGGVPGVDFDPDAPSVFRFGAQNRDEVAPARIRDASVECGLGRCPVGQEDTWVLRVRGRPGPTQHVGDRQAFHHDQVVTRNELSRGFVVEVATGIGNFAVKRRHRCASASTVAGAAFGTAHPLLCGRQLVSRVAPAAWIINASTVGGSGEGGDSHIDTDVAFGGRQRIGGHIVAGEDQRPPSALSADLNCFHPSSHLAMRGDLDLSNPSQIHAVGVRVPMGTITIFGPLDGVKTTLAFKPWISRFSRAFEPSVKSDERPIKASQRGLLARKRPHRHIRTNASDLAQLSRLIPIPNCRFAMGPGIAALLQCGIVELAMCFNTGRQRYMLARCRPQPKRVGAPHTIMSHPHLENDINGPAGRTPKHRCWVIGLRLSGQLRNSGSIISTPYEAPLTSFLGALWMYA